MAKTTTLPVEGQPVTGAAGSRCYKDLVEQRGQEAADAVAARAHGEMPRVRQVFPDARGLERFDVVVEALLLAAGVPEAEVPELARRYRSGAEASVDLSGYASAAHTDPTWDVVYHGTPEDVREFLEARLGTGDFAVAPDGSLLLRVPLVGQDRLPRPAGETTLVEVAPISVWSVEAPSRGGSWHAVPLGTRLTYCGIDTVAWTGERQRDDTHEITCPWCRLRLIAVEIVAPPGPRPLLQWYRLCIKTIRHSQDLATWEREGSGEATERSIWRRGSEILAAAEQEGAIVPVLFAAGEGETVEPAQAGRRRDVTSLARTSKRIASLRFFIRHEGTAKENFGNASPEQIQKWRDRLEEELALRERLRDSDEPADGNLIYYAQLTGVEVDEDSTTYRVTSIRRLANPQPLSSLVLESRGEPLSDAHIRPYAVCRTPAFLPPPEMPPVVPASTAQRERVKLDDDGGDEALRRDVRSRLSAGRTVEQTVNELVDRASVGRRQLWSIILEEEARAKGELNSYEPTPEAVVALREKETHRWERIAARVFGDAGPRATEEVKRLYDEARGPGAARRSYTGRGRRFPEME